MLTASKIEASVDRWIAEAAALGPRKGAAALRSRVRFVDEQMTLQGARRGPPAEAGIAYALSEAGSRLCIAAGALRATLNAS